MRHRLILLLATLLAACTSPNPVLYTLAVVPGTAQPVGPHTFEVRRIGLAGYLDRPGIVRSTDDYRLSIATDDRWGEPFGGMLQRVLGQDLSQRLPGTSVYSDAGAISADPDMILEVDIQRFDADSSGVVVLAAQISLRRGGDRQNSQTRSIRLTITPASSSTADYVAALSKGLAQLADMVAGMVPIA